MVLQIPFFIQQLITAEMMTDGLQESADVAPNAKAPEKQGETDESKKQNIIKICTV